MARFSSVSQAALLLLAAAAATAIQSGGERRPAAVPPHYFDRATPPLTVRHRPPRPSPPPYAVPMEPLLPYSQPDPLYHHPEPTAELQTLRKSSAGGDPEAAASGDELAPGPGPAPDALFPDSDAQPGHLPPLAAYGPPYPEQLYYVREPEPIIEIIIKESNESLPAPPVAPPPPPKKEPVHVFYVKYKKDPTKYGKDSVVYDVPVPAVTPASAEPVHTESHSYGPPPEHAVTAAPPPTTTLRTIIRPDSETYHGSGLRITFGGPHEEDSEVPSESAQRPSLALPQTPFQASPPFSGHFTSSHGPHKREHSFFPPPPSPPRPGPTAPAAGSFPPSAFQQPQGSFSAPHRPFSAPPTPFLRQLPGQAQPFAPAPPQRPPPQPFHGPPPPPKLRPQPQFGHQQQFQRPLHPPQQPPSFRPGPTAAFPPPPPPPLPLPSHGRSPPNQQYIEQQRKVIQQQQAELFQQQHQPPQQSHILQQLQQQRHQQQIQHQQQLQQQHLQQQRLQPQPQQQLQRLPQPQLTLQPQLQPQQQPQPQPQPQQQHQTAQQLGFNGEIVKSVPSLEEHLTTREGPSPPRPGHQFLGPSTSASHAHGLGQPSQATSASHGHGLGQSAPATSASLAHSLGQRGPSFTQTIQSEPRKPTTFTVQQSISQPQLQLQEHQQFQQSQQQYQLLQQQQQQQHLLQHQQLPSLSQPQETPASRPFAVPQSVRRPPLLPAAQPTTKPPKVFSLVPSSTAAPSPTTATPPIATADGDKDKKDKPLPALPDEVPEDLRQQLLSSGILSNADIQVLDYDKVGDIPIENLPPEALENFYGAGSDPVPAVVSPPNATAPVKRKASPAAAAAPAPVAAPAAPAAPVEMKVVRFNAATTAGQQLAEQYVRADATHVDPVVLNDAGYNRYLPLKVSGVGFPLPDVPELRGRNVTSVVILAPVDYDLLQKGDAAAADADAADAVADADDDADRAGRAAAIQVKGVRFVTGDILKDLVKNPTNENYQRWLERERKASAEQQAIILLVAEGTATASKEIFMYDAGSQRVSKLSGKLSAAFVDVAEANANSRDIDNISAASPHIMELRHRGSLDDVSAEGSEAAESRHPAPAVISISGGYSKTSASS